jgi:streptogramin lyase
MADVTDADELQKADQLRERGTGISHPLGITSGPDGALWFTDYGSNSIGRIKP